MGINIQLSVDEPTAQSALHNSHNQIFISFQQVLGITSGDVAPIFLSSWVFTLCGRDIDTAKLGADYWCSWYVFTSDISSDSIDENVVVALLFDNTLNRCTSLGQRGRFGVVVERCKICDDVFPATVIINASSGIQSSTTY